MCKHAVKKLPFIIKYVPDRHKTQQMRDKAVHNYAHVLKLIPNCYKTQKMCGKAVNTYPSTIQFVSECMSNFCVIKLLIDVFCI